MSESEQSRELTFEDVLRYAGASEAGTDTSLQKLMPDPSTLPRGASGGGGCGSGCSCGSGGGESDAGTGARDGRAPHPPTPMEITAAEGGHSILDKPVDRRGALGMILGALGLGTQAVSACSPAWPV